MKDKKMSKEKENIVPSPEENTLKQESVKTEEYTAEIIRDYYGNIDPFYLSKKDPNYAYRFLLETPDNLSLKSGNLLFQKGGWQICNKQHLLRIGMKYFPARGKRLFLVCSPLMHEHKNWLYSPWPIPFLVG